MSEFKNIKTLSQLYTELLKVRNFKEWIDLQHDSIKEQDGPQEAGRVCGRIYEGSLVIFSVFGILQSYKPQFLLSKEMRDVLPLYEESSSEEE